MVNRYLAIYMEKSSTPDGRQAWWIFSPSITTFIFPTRQWTTLRISATVFRASSCVNRSSIWTNAFIFFSPTSFSTRFSSFFSQVINPLTDDELTKFSLLYLFGCERECGKQLHKNHDNRLTHGHCRRDLGIDLKAIDLEEVPNRIEQNSQGTVVFYDPVDRLIRLNVIKMRA